MDTYFGDVKLPIYNKKKSYKELSLLIENLPKDGLRYLILLDHSFDITHYAEFSIHLSEELLL